MSKSIKISEFTTGRLSVYLRCLNTLAASGVKTISSQALAEQFALNSAQMRKDLAYFGEFGVRGVGYDVDELCIHITKILGLDRPHRVGIVGAGNLGLALAGYSGWMASNFTVVALFDDDPDKVRRTVGDAEIPVYNVEKLDEVVRDEDIDVAVIAVPAHAAQTVLDDVMAAGIKAVLNFAPAPLHARSDVRIKTVDLTSSLETLSFFLAESESKVPANVHLAALSEVASREEYSR